MQLPSSKIDGNQLYSTTLRWWPWAIARLGSTNFAYYPIIGPLKLGSNGAEHPMIRSILLAFIAGRPILQTYLGCTWSKGLLSTL